MFARRLGNSNRQQCMFGHNCSQVLEKHDGNFAVCGPVITEAAIKALPPGPGVGPKEGVVEVPREVFLAAVADLITTATAA